ncbi:hypothetical protein D3C85_1093970 [compost metagenome]
MAPDMIEMPMDRPTLTRVPSASAMGCEASRSKCSPRRKAAVASMPVTRTMNSSPPIRAATSSTRSMARMRSAMVLST